MTFFMREFEDMGGAEAAPFVAVRAIADMQLAFAETAFRLSLLPFGLLAAPMPAEDASDAAVTDSPSADAAPQVEPAPAVAETPAAAAPDSAGVDVAGAPPQLYAAPQGTADDLLLIRGIGPKLGQLLNSLGVWHYSQIVGWTPAEVAWINDKIDFRGRIQREGWQAQAAALLNGRKAA